MTFQRSGGKVGTVVQFRGINENNPKVNDIITSIEAYKLNCSVMPLEKERKKKTNSENYAQSKMIIVIQKKFYTENKYLQHIQMEQSSLTFAYPEFKSDDLLLSNTDSTCERI